MPSIGRRAPIALALVLSGCGASELERENHELARRVEALQLENDVLRGELRTAHAEPEAEPARVPAPAAEPAEPDVLRVRLAADGTTLVDDDVVDMAGLAER